MTPLMTQAAGLSMLREQMKSEGYAPGHTDPIDVQVCVESECFQCRHKELRCLGFRKSGPTSHSYRVFSACPKCGIWEEF